MNRRKISIEEFRKVKASYLECDNINIYLNEVYESTNLEDIIFTKKYELIEYLTSLDLSDIPSQEWKNFIIVCDKDHRADFSKTNANFDFNLMSVENKDYFNFSDCHLKNLEQLILNIGTIIPKCFDEKTVNENPHLFLKQSASKELQDAFYNGSIDMEYILNNPKYHNDLKEIDIRLFHLLLPNIKVDNKPYLLVNFIKEKFASESFNIIVDYGKYLSKSEVQEELSKIEFNSNYSKEKLLEKIELAIKKAILNGMKYNEDLPIHFKENNQTLFLDKEINKEIKEKFYQREYSIKNIIDNPSVLDYFTNIDITLILGKEYQELYGLFENKTCLKLVKQFNSFLLDNKKLLDYLQSLSNKPIPLEELPKHLLDYFYVSKGDLRTSYLLHHLGINDTLVEQAYNTLEKLLINREGIDLNNDILANEYFVKYGYDTIDIVTEYKSKADSILIEKDNDLYLKKWIDYVKKLPIYNRKMLHYAILSYENTQDLIQKLVDNDIDIDDIKANNLMKILKQNNKYGVTDVEQLTEYDKYRCKVLNEKIENSNDINEVRDLIMQALYNTSSIEAKNLINSFRLNKEQLLTILVKDMAINDKDLEMIKDIVSFSKIDNLEEIKNKYYDLLIDKLSIDNNQVVDVDTIKDKLKNFYAQKMKDSLYKPNSNTKVSSIKGVNDPSIKDINGKPLTDKDNIEVVSLDNDNFKLLVHFIHTFDKRYETFPQQLLDNPSKWNSLEGTSTISTSMISDICMKCLGNGSKDGVYYGFNDYSLQSFITMSICDASTKHDKMLLDPKSIGNAYEIPEILQEKTMDQFIKYNEILLDRKDEGISKFQGRIQPDCIICFSNDINDASKKTAQYFNIPIYVIDKEKYEERNKQKIESFKKKEITMFSANDVELILFMASNNFDDNYNLLMELNNKAKELGKIDSEEHMKIINDAERLKEYMAIYNKNDKYLVNEDNSLKRIGK